MSEQTGGCVINTPERDGVAVLVLPMNLDAFIDVLQASYWRFPGEVWDAGFDEVETLDELRANLRELT